MGAGRRGWPGPNCEILDCVFESLVFQAVFSLSRSEIQTLMMDGRVTPSRSASLSRERTIQLGKSTLTRRELLIGASCLGQVKVLGEVFSLFELGIKLFSFQTSGSPLSSIV